MSNNNKPGDDAPQTHHLNLITDDHDPSTVLVHAVADHKDVDPAELNPLYSCIDHLVDQLFGTPPPGEADAVLTFTYESFRITLYQDGLAVLRSPT